MEYRDSECHSSFKYHQSVGGSAFVLKVVSIWSVSYSLEKNSGSGGDVTNFINQARTCIDIVHVISRLLGLSCRLGHELVD